MQGLTTPAANVAPVAPYAGFDSLLIAGRWRKGRSQKKVDDVDPYRGDLLVSIPAANKEDVDEAYSKAAEAQRDWFALTPQSRRDVLLRALDVLTQRKEEISDLLIREVGST